MPYKKKLRRVKLKKRLPFSKKQAKAIIKLSHKSQELKQKLDTETDASVTASAPFHHDIGDFALAEGTGQDERIGDNIKIKDLMFLIRVIPGSVGFNTTTGHTYRLFVYQNYDDSSILAVMPGPLEFYPNPSIVNTSYKVLYNKVITLNPDNTNNKFHKIKIKGNMLKKVNFDIGASTITSNNVRCVLKPITDTANELQVVSSARIRYYD